MSRDARRLTAIALYELLRELYWDAQKRPPVEAGLIVIGRLPEILATARQLAIKEKTGRKRDWDRTHWEGAWKVITGGILSGECDGRSIPFDRGDGVLVTSPIVCELGEGANVIVTSPLPDDICGEAARIRELSRRKRIEAERLAARYILRSVPAAKGQRWLVVLASAEVTLKSVRRPAQHARDRKLTSRARKRT